MCIRDRISYDGEGKVKSIEGANEEGVAVAEAYKDYEGKACREVEMCIRDRHKSTSS